MDDRYFGKDENQAINSMRKIYFGEDVPSTRSRPTVKYVEEQTSRTQIGTQTPRVLRTSKFDQDLTIDLPVSTAQRPSVQYCQCGKDNDQTATKVKAEYCQCGHDNDQTATKVQPEYCQCDRRDHLPSTRNKVKASVNSSDIPSLHEFHGRFFDSDIPTSADKVHPVDLLMSLKKDFDTLKTDLQHMKKSQQDSHESVSEYIDSVTAEEKVSAKTKNKEDFDVFL